MRTVLAALLLAPLAARAAGEPAQWDTSEVQSVQPPGPAPTDAIPPPPAEIPPAPDEQPAAVAEQSAAPAGQWVYTAQYGWLWMPYGNGYTYLPPSGGTPDMYAYYPSVGWCWLVAPWVWGWGPMPYWGAYGPWGYGWYGYGYGHWYGYAGRYGGWYGGGYWHGGHWHTASAPPYHPAAPHGAGATVAGPRPATGAPRPPAAGWGGRPPSAAYGMSRPGSMALRGGYQAPGSMPPRVSGSFGGYRGGGFAARPSGSFSGHVSSGFSGHAGGGFGGHGGGFGGGGHGGGGHR